MTEKELRMLMLLLDISQVSIANKLGVPRSYVNQVITGDRAFPHVRQAIAEAVHKTVDEIWPPELKETEQANDSKEEPERQEEISGISEIDHEQKIPTAGDERQ